jgi:hypothetical protein
MSQILIEPSPPRARRVGDAARVVLIAVLVAALLAIAVRITDGPTFVDRVSVVNNTGYDLDVDVTNASHDGWLPLSVATAGTTDVTRDVIDMHDTWVFRFSHEGTPAGELQMSRDQLARDGWKVQVPARVAQQLRTADQLAGD